MPSSKGLQCKELTRELFQTSQVLKDVCVQVQRLIQKPSAFFKLWNNDSMMFLF